MSVQRTLAILKPDCVEKDLIGEVIRRIQDAGFTIRALKMHGGVGTVVAGKPLDPNEPGLDELIERAAPFRVPQPEQEAISSDGTQKFLFRLPDGNPVETVLIPDRDRRTVCISIQAGCALGCR